MNILIENKVYLSSTQISFTKPEEYTPLGAFFCVVKSE